MRINYPVSLIALAFAFPVVVLADVRIAHLAPFASTELANDTCGWRLADSSMNDALRQQCLGDCNAIYMHCKSLCRGDSGCIADCRDEQRSCRSDCAARYGYGGMNLSTLRVPRSVASEAHGPEPHADGMTALGR